MPMRRAVIHVLALVLATAMLFMGAQKFGADNYIFQVIAQRSGIALFEPQIRIFTGTLEILAGLLMMLPSTRGAGAVLATGVVGGAVLFHLSPWLGTSVAMSADGEASYRLFMMALVFLAIAVINLYLHRARIPVLGDRLFVPKTP